MARVYKSSFSINTELQGENERIYSLKRSIKDLVESMPIDVLQQAFNMEAIQGSFGVTEYTTKIIVPSYSGDKESDVKEFHKHFKKLVKDYEDQTGEKVSEIVFVGNTNNYFSFTAK